MKEDWKSSLGKLQQANKDTEKVSEDSFIIGTILKMALNKTDGLTILNGYNTRNKYFIIIGLTPEGNAIGSLLINHKINFNVHRTEEQQDCQFPLNPKDYPEFLTQKSYVDCVTIFEIPKERILRDGSVKGVLTPTDKELLFNFLKENEVITPKDKKKYGLL